MNSTSKILSEEELNILYHFWSRAVQERKNIEDVMVFSRQLEIVEDLIKKGFLKKTSTRFIKLTDCATDFLLAKESKGNV